VCIRVSKDSDSDMIANICDDSDIEAGVNSGNTISWML
jgi:hypothetical protein